MGLGIGLIALSIACLVIGFLFGASLWLNIVGLVAGLAGLVLLRRKKADNGK